MAQRNTYELTRLNGDTMTVVANSYRDVQRMIITFKMDVVKTQRIYKNGKRASVHNISLPQ